jgi:hypothetical protein
LANLIALLFLTSLFAAIVNGAASVIFPYAVPTVTSFPVAGISSFSSTSVLLASFFTGFGLLAVMGITIVVVPSNFRTGRCWYESRASWVWRACWRVFTMPDSSGRQASGLRVLHSVGVVSGSASDIADRWNGQTGTEFSP